MSSSFENKLTICEIDPMWEDFGKIDFSISLYQQMGYEIEFEIDPAWENFGKLPEWKQAPAWEQVPEWEVDKEWKARFEKWKARDEKWAERYKELESRYDDDEAWDKELEARNEDWDARFHEVLKARKEYFESEEFKSMKNEEKKTVKRYMEITN